MFLYLHNFSPKTKRSRRREARGGKARRKAVSLGKVEIGVGGVVCECVSRVFGGYAQYVAPLAAVVGGSTAAAAADG